MDRNDFLKLISQQVKGFNSDTKRFNDGHYIRAWFDEILCFFLFGATPDDYYQYAFFSKSVSERNTFITYRRSRGLIRENGANAEAIVEKDRFNKRFSEFLNRDWIDLQTATAESFIAFLDAHGGKAIMKPLGGACGKGIFIMTKEEFEKSNLSDFRKYIAEEIIIQNQTISRLNPHSVNTVRVLTYRGEILLCALKLGTGNSIVDNQHANGLNGNIDINTGITNTPFLDISLNEYYRHPTTNEILLGIQIPNWELLKKKVTAAAKMLPEVPYLGWDVAILENDIAIIEANEAPGHDLVQGASKIGVYKRIKQIRKKGHAEHEDN